jgi:hypothetical protein
VELIEVIRQAMIDGALPIDPRQWLPLGVGNGHDGHVGESPVKLRQVGKVEPAMQRGDVRRAAPAAGRIVQIVDVEVNHIEVGGALQDLVEQHHV